MPHTAPIHAVTFDLWDTLVIDDSDEVERARRGLQSKDATRRNGFAALARKHRPELSDAVITEAYNLAQARFRHWWKKEHHTPPVAEWLTVGFTALDIEDADGIVALADELAGMEVEIPPQPVPHVRQMLTALKGRVPLAIVSDTINTPASGLRAILRQHDLLDFFEVCAFSDEVGHSKPHRAGYAHVAATLGIPIEGIVHVGDRQETDVDGVQRVGGRAVLYTGAIDRHQGDTTAEVTCADYAAFEALLGTLGELVPGAHG